MKDPLETKICDYFGDKSAVVAIYLFGSYASGKQRPFSDIDIGIILMPSDRATYSKIKMQYHSDLCRILRLDVHPVIMNTAGEELLKQVFSKGRCLLVRDTRLLARQKTIMYSRIAEFGFYREMLQKGFVTKIMGEIANG